MTYGKIKSNKQIMVMPNPVSVTVANPTEEKKKLIADLDNWLECVYTEQPQYDPEVSYLIQYWEAEEVSGVIKAVQHWEVKPIEEPTE